MMGGVGRGQTHGEGGSGLPALFPTTHIPVQGWGCWPAHDLWGSGESKDFGAKLVGPESRKRDLGHVPVPSELVPRQGVVWTRWAHRGLQGASEELHLTSALSLCTPLFQERGVDHHPLVIRGSRDSEKE